MTASLSQTMTRMNRQQVFRRETGQPCIYCGIRLGATTEHIIPEAFGGRLTLENASCADCANETHAFEGHAGRLFLPLRRQLNIRGKRRSGKARLLRKPEQFTLRLDDIRRVKIDVGDFGWNAPEFVIVRLRLFANLQSQTHYIVIGRQHQP
jgi:hypothetical protein